MQQRCNNSATALQQYASSRGPHGPPVPLVLVVATALQQYASSRVPDTTLTQQERFCFWQASSRMVKTAKTTSCTGSLMTASPSHSRQGGSSSQQRPQRGGGGPLTHHRLGGRKITIRRRGRGTLRTMFTFEHSVAGAGVRTG